MNFFTKLLNKFKFAKEMSSLGGDNRSKVILYLICFWSLFRNKLNININFQTKLLLRKDNTFFNFNITDDSDFLILKEIFLDNEYDCNLEKDPEVIFDLGSNVGLSVIYFKLKYPQAKIFAFEPDSVTFEKLKINLEQFSDVYCYNMAISEHNGLEKFYSCTNRSMSSSLVQRVEIESSQKIIEVQSKNLDTLMAEFAISKIDLIKFDVEGAEYDVFKNFKNICLVNNVIGELHLDLIKESKENFVDLFKNFSVQLRPTSSCRFLFKAKIQL